MESKKTPWWRRAISGATIIEATGWRVLAVALISALVLLGVTPGAAGALEEQKVTLCHATPPDSAKNGYNQLTISANAVFKDGHDGHAKDIIPPFTYTNAQNQPALYPGKNWDPAGQAIFANGCKVKVAPPPVKPRPPAGVVRPPVGAVDTGGGPLPDDQNLAIPLGVAGLGLALVASGTAVILRRRKFNT
jgi:hypothetical protein